MICKSRQYAFQFAQPEDQTRREDDENPVHRGKGYYAEHASAKSRDDDLSYKNQQGDEDEVATFPQPVQGTPPCHKCFGVEHIPELEENEYGEECTQLKVGKGILYRPEVEEGSSPCTEVEVHHAVELGMFEVLDQAEEQ